MKISEVVSKGYICPEKMFIEDTGQTIKTVIYYSEKDRQFMKRLWDNGQFMKSEEPFELSKGYLDLEWKEFEKPKPWNINDKLVEMDVSTNVVSNYKLFGTVENIREAHAYLKEDFKKYTEHGSININTALGILHCRLGEEQ